MKIKIQNLSLLILASIWLVPQISCVPEGGNLQNIVITEDVIYISGERVRLTGRVLEVNGSVDDHGFHISTNEDFTSPIVIALGPKSNGLGRFIGSYQSLLISTPYYYRSYLNVGGEEITGKVKEFASLKPRIVQYGPLKGIEGTAITLEGANFSQDTRVFVDNREVVIASLTDESLIKFAIPGVQETNNVEVRVEVQDTVMTFSETFTYREGAWLKESAFPSNLQLYESMFFRDGDQFIVGFGWSLDVTVMHPEVWGVDLTTGTWSNLNFPLTNQGVRAPFVSGNLWGSGAGVRTPFDPNLNLSPFFWEYSGGNFIQRPFLNFRLYSSIGLTLNNDLFVFGGTLTDQSLNFDIRKFQKSTGTWSIVGQAPYELSYDNSYFSFNNEAYFLFEDGRIVKYNPLLDSWSDVGQYPGNVRVGGGAVVINDKVYIGLFRNDNRIWEWNLLTGEWIQKNDFTGNPRSINNGFFSYDNKAYFFRSAESNGVFEPDPRMELWSLDPNKLK